MEKSLYLYEGPVMIFGKCVANKWTGRTYATSPLKAKSNLAYQFKQATGKLPGTRVDLPGLLRCKGEL